MKFIDLTDSFILGFERHGLQYWMRVPFALSTEHPAYSPPLPNEHACYRHGWLKADEVHSVDADWNRLSASFGPDGEVDFGSIDRLDFADGALVCEGDWGQVRVVCDTVAVELDER